MPPRGCFCRVGLGGRLGRLLGGIFATTAASPELAPLRCWVEGPAPRFLAVSLCLLLLGSQPPSLWFVTGAEVSPQLRCTRRSFGFLLLNAMTREVVFEKKKRTS
jgi:hypothetical protein